MDGYVRASARVQNEARPPAALEAHSISPGNLYLDKQSGKGFERPVYKRLMKRLWLSDLLIVKSIDHLDGDYAEILGKWRYIAKGRGTDIMILDVPLLNT